MISFSGLDAEVDALKGRKNMPAHKPRTTTFSRKKSLKSTQMVL